MGTQRFSSAPLIVSHPIPHGHMHVKCNIQGKGEQKYGGSEKGGML